MSPESMELKLVRIEERIKAVIEMIAELKEDKDEINTLKRDIAVLKRDRFWLFTLSSSAFAISLVLLAARLSH